MAPLVKFYYDPLSPPSRALLIFFKLAKISVEEKDVRRSQIHEHSLNEDTNRFHQVPVILDGDFELSESVAILRYMVAKNPVDDHWYPKDAKDRARVDEYLSWALHNMHTLAENLNAPEMTFLCKFRDANLNGPQNNTDLIKNLEKALDELEELWTGTEYISGDQLTIADVYAACDVEQTRMVGISPLENRPKLAVWFDRTRKQLEPYFTEHHKCIYEAVEE